MVDMPPAVVTHPAGAMLTGLAKEPASSAGVGTLIMFRPGVLALRHSSDQKKKVLSFCGWYTFGMNSGPPRVNPKSLYRSIGTVSAEERGCPAAIEARPPKVFAL